MKIQFNSNQSNFKKDLPIILQNKTVRMHHEDVSRLQRLQILLYDLKFKKLNINYRKDSGVSCIEIMFDNISMYLIPRKLFVVQNNEVIEIVTLKHYSSIINEWIRKKRIYLIPDYFSKSTTKEWDKDTLEDFNQFLKTVEIAFNRRIKLSTIAQ